ncbi:DUF2975 domain-containing protein [Arenicella xantha]|uniref:DUF2975 family protein n=1 Tax=Arenicella xantha TaxID=644221 RepID=A0A395JM09_9GAMM|nr:DUF2975 domain-containing protein [Arenicella xantha]RBP51741.1 DUF2975 family protein [Arenicella xantha]
MTKQLSTIIYWACLIALLLLPIGACYLLFQLPILSQLAQQNLNLPISWESVSREQWIVVWALGVAYASIGWLGIYFLRIPFTNFARGELFTYRNTKNLRSFAKCLLAQTLLTPIFHACLSVVLSWNHPAGQKILSITMGSNELRSISLALIIWVVSDILLAGEQLKLENQQFI